MNRAVPLADNDLVTEINNIILKAGPLNKVKRGANEATKSLNRDQSEIIVMAADASPLEIILHLPLLCEDKNVPYIFVPSMVELGQACGTSRPVIACSIAKLQNDKSLDSEINDLKIKIEKCFLNN